MSLITKVLLLSVTTFIYGCGGQGEDATGSPLLDQSSNGAAVSGPTNTGQGINGGLTGRLITTVSSEPYEFDLLTGAATPLPLVSGGESIEGSSRRNFFAAGDGSPNQGYVENQYNCMSLPLPGIACLSVYDSNFQTVSRLRIDDAEILSEPAKLSPTGRFVLVSEVFTNFDYNYIRFYDVGNGDLVDEVFIDNRTTSRGFRVDNSVVEWGQNEEIYYSVPADIRPTVYITNPGTLELDRTITLPPSFIGEINGLDISPNGDQLLIEMRANRDGRYSAVIILDLITLEIRIPAVDPADENRIPLDDDFVSQFKNPMWSPDGQYIMFLNSFTTGGNPILVPGIEPPTDYMVAVPADSNRLVVNSFLDDNLPEPPAIAIQLADPNNGRIEFDWPASTTVNNGHVEWIE